jgi:hypothetical protein
MNYGLGQWYVHEGKYGQNMDDSGYLASRSVNGFSGQMHLKELMKYLSSSAFKYN